MNESHRWNADRANAWYANQAWPCGFNYLPRTAVNFVDMWHAETFDEATIGHELGLAAAIGYNSTRVNIQFVQWDSDSQGTIARLRRYLELSDKHGFSTVFCLFDDCEFSGVSPTNSRQPDPIPGVHNSRGLGSPGRTLVRDQSQWPRLERYVKQVLREFADDPRVLYWDLYNEPGNQSVFAPGAPEVAFDAELRDHSLSLCKKTFEWARSIDPMQPLTSGAWMLTYAWKDGGERPKPFQGDIDQFVLGASDIITFHAYVPYADMVEIVSDLAALGRPLMITEWLARSAGSHLVEQLPYFKEHKIGCYQWGFVNGRSQTHIPWPALKSRLPNYDEATSEWFHDVLRPDGSPYRQDEMDLVSALTGAAR